MPTAVEPLHFSNGTVIFELDKDTRLCVTLAAGATALALRRCGRTWGRSAEYPQSPVTHTLKIIGN